jgi:hypothetical protein
MRNALCARDCMGRLWVAHHSYEQRGHEEGFGECVCDDHVQHHFHAEVGQHDDFGVEKDGEVDLVNDNCYVG